MCLRLARLLVRRTPVSAGLGGFSSRLAHWLLAHMLIWWAVFRLTLDRFHASSFVEQTIVFLPSFVAKS